MQRHAAAPVLHPTTDQRNDDIPEEHRQPQEQDNHRPALFIRGEDEQRPGEDQPPAAEARPADGLRNQRTQNEHDGQADNNKKYDPIGGWFGLYFAHVNPPCVLRAAHHRAQRKTCAKAGLWVRWWAGCGPGFALRLC